MRSQRQTALWIFFSFAVWAFVFRGFLSSKFSLISDAVSYYDHTKFFIENLGRGIYPLWDPFWNNGAPNDFFLRRIGALNPFYLVILVLKGFGISYTLAYLWFLGGYYWSGMIAFYLLAKRLYHDSIIAYAGYLLLLFSALGTRLFDSYMMLVTVPLIWFFYFLVAFSQTPRKHFFLGLMLFAMILAGTYIPLYFLIILGLFTVLYSLIYPDQLAGNLHSWRQFFKENKILVLLTFLLLIFSFFPMISFFHDSAHGQVVMPIRHGSMQAGQAQILTVPHQTLDWGVPEDLMYSYYFSDLRLFKFAVVYVPFFSIILILLGLAGRINRRAVLIFLTGSILFCSIVPHGFPIYDFFYRHVFFLKYFRNLHFFIWFFLIPLFVIFALEQWKVFSQIKFNDIRQQYLMLAYIFAVHLIVFIFVYWRKDAIFSTYLMIILSFVFFALLSLKLLRTQSWAFSLLTLAILIQPLQAYYYFSLKALPKQIPYDYDFSFNRLQFKNTSLIKPESVPVAKAPLYFAAGDYNFVYQNISDYALAKYLQHKFILVDHLAAVERDQVPTLLEHDFLSDADHAVIFKEKAAGLKLDGDDPHPPLTAFHIERNAEKLKVLSFDADHVCLALDIPYAKFLIYNDSYDPYWKVSIDRHPSRIVEVNGAFKGVWVPAGQSIVEFSYGAWWQYAMNILLSIFALIILAGVIFYACVS